MLFKNKFITINQNNLFFRRSEQLSTVTTTTTTITTTTIPTTTTSFAYQWTVLPSELEPILSMQLSGLRNSRLLVSESLRNGDYVPDFQIIVSAIETVKSQNVTVCDNFSYKIIF